MKIIGYWEEYKCGCASETVRLKRELLGYCGKHGAARRYVYRELSEEDMAKLNEGENDGSAQTAR